MHTIKTHSSEVEEWIEITYSAVSGLEDERDYYQKMIKQFEKLIPNAQNLSRAPVSLELFYSKLKRIEEEIKLGYAILDELDKGNIPNSLMEPKRA